MGDLRTSKTLRSLKNAFLTLLEEERFEDITVQELCQKAEIRRATFYNHFEDKYDYLAFFIREMREEFIQEMDESTSPITQENGVYYDRIFHRLLAFLEEHPKIAQNMKNSQMLSTITEIFAEEVQNNAWLYLNFKQPHEEKANEMKAIFYAGGIMQLLLSWIKNPDHFKINSINWLDYLRKTPIS